MYEFDARIRFSEVNANGDLKLTALLNYFQDCSTFQSEDLGIGVEYLASMDLGWVINNWQIDIIRMPRLGDKVIVGTLPYKLRAYLGYRNFYMKDAVTGEYLAKANSIWTLINIREVKPVKATQQMIDAYVLSDPIEMEYLDRRVKLEGEKETKPAITVGIESIDTNLHVNNEQYIQMAMRFLPEDIKVKRLMVEYKKAAYLGNIIVPQIIKSEDGVGVSLENEAGDPYVTMRFS